MGVDLDANYKFGCSLQREYFMVLINCVPISCLLHCEVVCWVLFGLWRKCAQCIVLISFPFRDYGIAQAMLGNVFVLLQALLIANVWLCVCVCA